MFALHKSLLSSSSLNTRSISSAKKNLFSAVRLIDRCTGERLVFKAKLPSMMMMIVMMMMVRLMMMMTTTTTKTTMTTFKYHIS